MAERRCRITDQPIDTDALLRDSVGDADGAALLFVGTVRNHNDGREVGHLDYQAYPEMAEKVLEEIVAEAEGRWDVGGMSVVHRVGRLEIGEASVAIVVASQGGFP